VLVRDRLRDWRESGFRRFRVGGPAVVDRERRAFVFDLHAFQQRAAQRACRRFKRRAIGAGFRRQPERVAGPGVQPVIADDDQSGHAGPPVHVGC